MLAVDWDVKQLSTCGVGGDFWLLLVEVSLAKTLNHKLPQVGQASCMAADLIVCDCGVSAECRKRYNIMQLQQLLI